MHAAKIEKSSRLRRVVDYLRGRGRYGATTKDIIRDTGVCAVNSIVSEIRANGIFIDCKCQGVTNMGGRIYRYTLLEGGQRELFKERC